MNSVVNQKNCVELETPAQQSSRRRAQAQWDWSLWQQWVVANAVGELVGLGLVAAIGGSLAWRFGEPKSVIAALLMAGAMVLLGVCEGIIVGYAQWLALRRPLLGLSSREWVKATAIGAFLAWGLGMIPSTLMTLRESAGAALPAEMSDAIRYGMAAAMGLGLGVALGVPQWLVLRRYVNKAGWWAPANAVAWAVGMPVIFIGAGSVPPGGIGWPVILCVALTLAVAGAVVGAIHGLALVWLLRPSRVAAA